MKHQYRLGTVPGNKASHLLAVSESQAMSKQFCRVKSSLIYKYTKKGVLLEDKVGPCSTSSTTFSVYQVADDMVW